MGKPGKSGENEEAEQMVANALKVSPSASVTRRDAGPGNALLGYLGSV